MRFAWLFLLTPIVALLVAVPVWVRFRKKSKKRSLRRVAIIAHTSTVKKLPAYQRAIRQYRITLIAALACFIITLFAFTGVIAQPVSSRIQESEATNRDVVLCMDVSGSMDKYQSTLLSFFKDVIKDLKGQRVGVTIFDGVASTIIPLSDDYGAVSELIDDLSTNFRPYGYAVYSSERMSAIGDGVIGCIHSLDKLEDSERSQSIIVATDNAAGPGQTVDINQAAHYAHRYGVTLYGVYVDDRITTGNDVNGNQFRNAVNITGGSFYSMREESDGGDIRNNIVEKIFEQEAAKITGAAELVYSDSPSVFILISAASFVAFMVLIWRLRL